MFSDQYYQERDRHYRRSLRDALHGQRSVVPQRPPRRISRAIGRSMIRIGSHLAAEPDSQRARLP
jgi:hypothetical protein